jgi:hypothetical protein
LYRIHGVNQPELHRTCDFLGLHRITNEDVINFYSRVKIGATGSSDDPDRAHSAQSGLFCETARDSRCVAEERQRRGERVLHQIHFNCSMTVPSEIVGRATPVLLAFLAIHSRAARLLSSAPALSW